MKRAALVVSILIAMVFWVKGTDIQAQKQTETKQMEPVAIDWERLEQTESLEKPLLDSVRDIKAVVRQCREQRKNTSEKRTRRESWLQQMFIQDLEAGIPISDLMRLPITPDRETRTILDLAYSEYISRQTGIYPEDSPVTTAFLMLISQVPGVEELMTLLTDDAAFHQLYWIGPMRIKDSHVISRAQMLLAVLAEASDEEFKRRTANKTFYPHDIAFALRTLNFSEQRLIWLLDLAVDLEDKPLFMSMNGIFPVLNLADDAVQRLDVATLKILKRYGVTPTDITGAMTALDIALSQRESDAQRSMVEYLINEGYQAHYQRTTEYELGIKTLELGTQFYLYSVTDKDLIQFLDERTPFIDANRPDLGYDPSPDTSAAEVVKVNLNNIRQSQKCHEQALKLDELELVLPFDEKYKKLGDLPKDEPFERVIAEAQTFDPVLADMYAMQNQNGERPFASDSALSSKIDLTEESVEKMMSVVSNQSLSSRDLSRLLHLVVSKPEFTAVWLQVSDHSHLTSLAPLKSLRCEKWKTLREQGFDFSLTDSIQRNLYSIAFSCGPEWVDLLMDAGVPVLSQSYGSDALDLALDYTYVDEMLHPSLSRILKQTESLESSHNARLARLRLFQPKLYANIIAMKPEIRISPEQKPNPLINNRM
ncbi:hypothetical protein JYB88_13725 [Shewanella cyperi]|uniref:Uncharacterized protein n=1 Tax=Shewanella cyperi TaxID=2814292 RepID=A0A975AKE6_9GAMM|nr:hypothetical protein [Shewanella cyperi]QSX29267.1 hypothetical protein JYB88_13725 [Shewanella cyperi]